MSNYLVRIIKYYWNPLTKAVKHEPVCSKSLFLTEEPTLNQLKEALDLLAIEISENLGANNSIDKGDGGKETCQIKRT